MTGFKLKRILPLMMGALLLTHCSCDFFGTTGSLLISEKDEEELGLEFHTQLLKDTTGDYPVYAANTSDRQALKAYVENLGNELLGKIDEDSKPGYNFTFTLIDKDIENAFAVPGGYVYIYTGIIKQMQDESELVGVMGHEIAHITRHHYRDAMAKDQGLAILLQALLGNDAGQLAQLVAGSFFQLATLKVSRDNEAESDFYGTKYTGSVGRNPMGIAKFFGRMAGSGMSWVSTHPDPPDRVGDVTELVNESAVLKALAQDSLVTNFQSNFAAKTQVLRQ